MQIFIGKKKNKKCKANTQNHPKTRRKNRCQALCCCCSSSRLSISSISSSSEPFGRFDQTKEIKNLSNLAHGMVQACLSSTTDEKPYQLGFHQRQRSDQLFDETVKQVHNINNSNNNSRKCVVLIAMEQDSYDMREDFRRSIMDVITCNGLVEPKELRGLLNCYVSMNSCEHRQMILETFIDVCSALFVGRRGL
ncbi:hypothetical protein LUZ60_017623 [Juncus effusus]|nr:hypothetical protein LUZ60_017623 [Juncus effusus]